MSDVHQSRMQKAIESAKEGIEKEEGGPFGACVVYQDQVIAVAHNTVLKSHDPTAHAEINAIREACEHLGTHVLKGCILYTSAEPCPMCLAAIYWARMDKVYVGTEKGVAAEFGFDDVKFYEELILPIDQREIPTQMGVLSKDSEAVFETWKALGGELY